MKLLKRNLKPVWYCNYLEEIPTLDDEGYETGDKRIVYTDPKCVECNVSAEKGEAQLQVFGNLDSYEKVILMDSDYGIDENSVLFVDKDPEVVDGKPIYDYIVKRVAKSLNSVAIAVSKVTTS